MVVGQEGIVGEEDGGCFCRDIRYRVRGASVWKAGCCCQSCTRLHSAPYVVWAGFAVEDFTWLSGSPQFFRSSPHVLRSFCPRCGSKLTYQKDATAEPRYADAAKIIYVSVPTLDHPEVFPPDEVVRAGERVAWLDLGSRIPLQEDLSPVSGHLQVGLDSSQAKPGT